MNWTDIYGIHHWRIVWSSYRKLAWVGFNYLSSHVLRFINDLKVTRSKFYFSYKVCFSGKRQRKSTKNLNKTCHWKLIFVIWSYWHVSRQGTLAREHLSTQSSWQRKSRNLADSDIIFSFYLSYNNYRKLFFFENFSLIFTITFRLLIGQIG